MNRILPVLVGEVALTVASVAVLLTTSRNRLGVSQAEIEANGPAATSPVSQDDSHAPSLPNDLYKAIQTVRADLEQSDLKHLSVDFSPSIGEPARIAATGPVVGYLRALAALSRRFPTLPVNSIAIDSGPKGEVTESVEISNNAAGSFRSSSFDAEAIAARFGWLRGARSRAPKRSLPDPPERATRRGQTTVEKANPEVTSATVGASAPKAGTPLVKSAMSPDLVYLGLIEVGDRGDRFYYRNSKTGRIVERSERTR